MQFEDILEMNMIKQRKCYNNNNNNNNNNNKRNGAKTINLQTSFGDLIIRNGAKTINLQTSFGDLIIRNGAKTIWGLNNNNNNKKRCKNNKSPNFAWGLINKKRSKHNMYTI
jgi:hypothetical protein